MNSMARRCPAEQQTGDMFRAYVLQCLARYFPRKEPESPAAKAYWTSVEAINQLSATDSSGLMPSCLGPHHLTAQIVGTPEEKVLGLSEEEITAALVSCVEKMEAFLHGMDGSMVNRRIAFSSQGHMVNLPMWVRGRRQNSYTRLLALLLLY